MPLLFGIWGFLFPAGLVLYWTTTNLFQIGQQGVMLRRGMIGGSGRGKTTGDGADQGSAAALQVAQARWGWIERIPSAREPEPKAQLR
jgi:hypothetical protein